MNAVRRFTGIASQTDTADAWGHSTTAEEGVVMVPGGTVAAHTTDSPGPCSAVAAVMYGSATHAEEDDSPVDA